MRLIDADVLLDEITTHKDKSDMPELWYEGVDFAKWFIFNAPTIDHVRHGEWEETNDPMFRACSVCGYLEYECNEGNYCPECGSKMDGGEK